MYMVKNKRIKHLKTKLKLITYLIDDITTIELDNHSIQIAHILNLNIGFVIV